MLIFHRKKIALKKNIYKRENNFIQIDALKRANSFFNSPEIYRVIYGLKSNDIISFIQLFKKVELKSLIYTLFELKKCRGICHRTTIPELSHLSGASSKEVEYILFLLEEIKIISISNTAIIEIKYLDE